VTKVLNLQIIGEHILATSLEGPFGVDITLIGPDGKLQEVKGQVVRTSGSVSEDSRGISQGGRQSLVSNKSSVVLRESSLDPVPNSEEQWMCVIPEAPVEGSERVTLYVETVPQESRTFGMVTLQLTTTRPIV